MLAKVRTLSPDKFPDKAREFCSSDQKVAKIRAALTSIVDLLHYRLKRPVRILAITGLRAEEARIAAKC
ncbi:hypothetical protein [Saccharothrix variisporea]|uniref:hypothetical protein n=1 Tax=Saccharothrix variisporea TaxID=543527 RepID=UPI0011C47A2F